MKWLIYGAGLLVSSIILTALRFSPMWPHLGGLGAGLITCALYFFGVFFIPRKVIPLADARKKSSPSASEGSPSDKPAKRPKLRPCRPDVVGYQFAIFILIAALFVSLITDSPAYRELENEMEVAVNEAYHEGYNDGYDDGYADTSERYDEGYLDGYADGYEYCENGGLWLPSERDTPPSFSDWSNAKHGK